MKQVQPQLIITPYRSLATDSRLLDSSLASCLHNSNDRVHHVKPPSPKDFVTDDELAEGTVSSLLLLFKYGLSSLSFCTRTSSSFAIFLVSSRLSLLLWNILPSELNKSDSDPDPSQSLDAYALNQGKKLWNACQERYVFNLQQIVITFAAFSCSLAISLIFTSLGGIDGPIFCFISSFCSTSFSTHSNSSPLQ